MYVRPQEVGRSLIFLHGALSHSEGGGERERERETASLALGPSIKASFIGKDGAEGRKVDGSRGRNGEEEELVAAASGRTDGRTNNQRTKEPTPLARSVAQSLRQGNVGFEIRSACLLLPSSAGCSAESCLIK